MVSIAGKVPTVRSATATSLLLFSRPETYSTLLAARLRKGDALSVARIAGIQAAKKTSDLIPLAHPGLGITAASVRLEPFVGNKLPYPLTKTVLGLDESARRLYGGVLITATVSCEGKTGVEMEAITAASIAGLTMYDMLKAVDKSMVLTETRVVAKSGGKSGDWTWDYQANEIVKANEEKEKENELEQLHQLLKDKEIQERVASQHAAVDDNSDALDMDGAVPGHAIVEANADAVADANADPKQGSVSADDFRAARRKRLARSMADRRSQRVEHPSKAQIVQGPVDSQLTGPEKSLGEAEKADG